MQRIDAMSPSISVSPEPQMPLQPDLISSWQTCQELEPLLIKEDMILPFKFWMDSQIQQGMRLWSELFRYISRFDSHQRQQAFDLAWMLSQQGVRVVITTTNAEYTVWMSLRSLETTAGFSGQTGSMRSDYSPKGR